jgi:hypothetical protein
MSAEDEAIDRARSLFESGAEIVYLMVDETRVLVEREHPHREGVVLTARSLHEVESFVREQLRRRRS